MQEIYYHLILKQPNDREIVYCSGIRPSFMILYYSRGFSIVKLTKNQFEFHKKNLTRHFLRFQRKIKQWLWIRKHWLKGIRTRELTGYSQLFRMNT